MKTIRITLRYLLLLLSASAHAERADAQKPISMAYDDIRIDNVTRNTIATGHVVIVRGTMVVNADRAEVNEAPDGYRTYLLTAASGKLVTFRQKRDGGPDLWSEGHAQRMDYLEREDMINLHVQAMLRQLEGRKVMQQMDQAFISYNNRSEQLEGHNGPGIAGAPPNGRGTVTFEVRRSRVAAPPTPAQ